MTILDFLMAEYQLGARSFWTVPLTAAFVLLMTARDRHGDAGPSFADGAVLRARARARAALEEAFLIVPDPVAP